MESWSDGSEREKGASMKLKVFRRLFPLIGFVLASSAAHATSHEFFKGKTVRLLVGVSAGGALDDWGRFEIGRASCRERV